MGSARGSKIKDILRRNLPVVEYVKNFHKLITTIKQIESEVTMKGQDQIIKTLNELLADELTAINQYIVHSSICEDWMYDELHEAIEKRAITEMNHAEKLINRIIFLDGIPIVTNLNKINIGKDIETQLKNDLQAEYGAVSAYNNGIKTTVELGDNGTRELLESILKDEEEHVDWIEAQLSQIEHMGIQNYLVEQTG